MLFLWEEAVNLPLAGSSGSVNDGLRCLNLTKASSVSSKSLIISVWMKTSDVDIAIAWNRIGQALVKSSHALARSEDSRNSLRNSGVLHEQCLKIDIDGDLVGQRLGNVLISVLNGKLLGRWCRSEGRTVNKRNLSALLTVKKRSIVWSSWSRLIGSGVRTATILESRNLLVKVVSSLRIVAGGSSARSIWHEGETRHITRISSLWKVWHSSGGVRAVAGLRELAWAQWLSRIQGRSHHDGIVCRIVIELTSSEGSRSHIGVRHGEVGELIHHLAHGSSVVLSTLSKGSLLALRVSGSACLRLSVHVGCRAVVEGIL